jgi:hypothetical protein
MGAAIARRKDCLNQLVGEIENTGSAAPILTLAPRKSQYE